MITLCIRTDKPEAEVGLYDDERKLGYEVWTGHRQLAETLLGRIHALITRHNLAMEDIQGIVCYKGPGSFTGLRIGLSVANSLAYGLKVPIVGTTGDDWVLAGVAHLQAGQREAVVLPEYGAEVHITRPKH